MENNELKTNLKLKDAFEKSRYSEKVDFAKLRYDLAIRIINLRDKVACKRHSERLTIINAKY